MKTIKSWIKKKREKKFDRKSRKGRIDKIKLREGIEMIWKKLYIRKKNLEREYKNNNNKK